MLPMDIYFVLRPLDCHCSCVTPPRCHCKLALIGAGCLPASTIQTAIHIRTRSRRLKKLFVFSIAKFEVSIACPMVPPLSPSQLQSQPHSAKFVPRRPNLESRRHVVDEKTSLYQQKKIPIVSQRLRRCGYKMEALGQILPPRTHFSDVVSKASLPLGSAQSFSSRKLVQRVGSPYLHFVFNDENSINPMAGVSTLAAAVATCVLRTCFLRILPRGLRMYARVG